jgi:excisionase family DNA binding protein
MALMDNKLDVNQAAKYVGCNSAFIRRGAKLNKIPHVRLGNRYFFEKETLNKLVEPHNNVNKDGTK